MVESKESFTYTDLEKKVLICKLGVSLVWSSHDLFYDNNYNKKKRIDKVKVLIYVGDLDVTGKDVINVITAITVRFLLFQRVMSIQYNILVLVSGQVIL